MSRERCGGGDGDCGRGLPGIFAAQEKMTVEPFEDTFSLGTPEKTGGWDSLKTHDADDSQRVAPTISAKEDVR